MIEFIEISIIEYINNMEYVNDISVENNHNYIANDYIVHNCITTSNVSIHYPQASLINECYKIKQKYSSDRDFLPKIVADGGIRNYDHVIKALALGADYVMIGSLFAQCIESAGIKYMGMSNNSPMKFNYDAYVEDSLYIDSNGNWMGRIKQLRDDDYIGELNVKLIFAASKNCDSYVLYE